MRMKWKVMDCDRCWFKDVCDIPYYPEESKEETELKEETCFAFLKKIKRKMRK